MDFDLEWHQEELQRTARSLLAKESTLENLIAWEDGQQGYSTSLYREMAKLGWLALGHGDKSGRITDVVELAVLYEELGRAALPGPHFWSSVLGGHLLAALGRGDWIESITQGEKIVTVGIDEPESGRSPATLKMRAEASADGVTLTGTKAWVPWAEVADAILVLARTGRGSEDLTFFLVPRDAAGMTLESVPVLSGEKTAFIHFEGCILPAEARLGEPGSGWAAWRRLLPAAGAIQAAEMVGLAAAGLELGVQYAKDRIAFGKPIGTLQAIQHKCAEMAVDCDAARFLTYEAICLLNEGLEDDRRVLMAKAMAAPVARRVTKESHQIFAAAGFVRNHRLNFYYRRAKGLETNLGSLTDHLELVAAALAAE